MIPASHWVSPPTQPQLPVQGSATAQTAVMYNRKAQHCCSVVGCAASREDIRAKWGSVCQENVAASVYESRAVKLVCAESACAPSLSFLDQSTLLMSHLDVKEPHYHSGKEQALCPLIVRRYNMHSWCLTIC